MAAEASDPTKVEHLGSEVLAEGHLRLQRLTLRTDLFSGGTAEIQREVVLSGPAVAVLLYDPAAHTVILIEQFRVGAWLCQQQGQLASAWLLECVAGKIDPGELREEAVRREAMEESGCAVGALEYAGGYLSSPGIGDELVHIYVGRVDSTHVARLHGKESEGEDIRTLVLPVEQALAIADSGAVSNMVTQLALLWFARHGDALRRRWLRGSDASEPGRDASHTQLGLN